MTLFLCISAPLMAQSYETHYLSTAHRQILNNNSLYRIPWESLVMNFCNADKASPISVPSGSVAAIELYKGQILKVVGSHSVSKTTTPYSYGIAYPGIHVPAGATLIIFGDGEVIAEGGKGGIGEIGENGGGGFVTTSKAAGGDGGGSGRGGGGGAPGIGGTGGIGGDGISGAQSTKKDIDMDKDYDENPVKGKDNPNVGGNGSDMGTLIVLGNVKVTSTAGAPGDLLVEYGFRGPNDELRKRNGFLNMGLSDLFKLGYGGAGGNGGSGGEAKYGIGGGAPGAGGGGSGAAGGFMSYGISHYSKLRFPTGAGGKGGKSTNPERNGRDGEGIGYNSVKGGEGGKPGQYGGNGTFMHTGSVILNSTFDPNSEKLITSLEDIPEMARTLVARTISGAKWANDAETLTMFFGQEMPSTNVVVPVDEQKGSFLGYVDQFGKMVYDQNGALALDAEDHSDNFTYKDKVWYLTAKDGVELTPRWSGFKNIYVIRYLENPNFGGNPADPQRYLSSSNVITEIVAVPAEQTDKEYKISLYNDAQGNSVIDPALYSSADNNGDNATVSLRGDETSVRLELKYDARKFNLSWEGLDDDMMSRQCLNLNDYTKAGSLSYGRVLVLPELRQLEGKAFDQWECKNAKGEYETFDGETMPANDLVLRPKFKEQKFSVRLNANEGGKAEIFLKDSEPAQGNSLTDIAFHEDVCLRVSCNEDYRCKNVAFIGQDMLKEVEYSEDGDTYTFRMPDENVVANVEFEYHPHCTLAAIRATENGASVDSIVYYATKDWKTYYTDYNDYYKFSDESFGGNINAMEYSIGDQINIVTNFRGDDGSRQPKVFLIKNIDNKRLIMEEMENRQFGFADSTVIFFPITVDSLMAKSDMPLQLQWSLPRTKFRIVYAGSDVVKMKEIYANGRSIISSNVAYAGEQINFRVTSSDPTFNHENVSLIYKDGYTQRYIETGINEATETDTIYSFMMPESDIDLTFKMGDKYKIVSDCSNYGITMFTPTAAVAGYPVRCIIQYNTDLVDVPDDDDIHLYINGEAVVTEDEYQIAPLLLDERVYADMPQNICTKIKTFIMPENDAFVSLDNTLSADGIEYVKAYYPYGQHFSSPYQGMYNLNGNKIHWGQQTPGNIYILNGKKYYSR